MNKTRLYEFFADSNSVYLLWAAGGLAAFFIGVVVADAIRQRSKWHRSRIKRR
jgi:hypothetical protein